MIERKQIGLVRAYAWPIPFWKPYDDQYYPSLCTTLALTTTIDMTMMTLPMTVTLTHCRYRYDYHLCCDYTVAIGIAKLSCVANAIVMVKCNALTNINI